MACSLGHGLQAQGAPEALARRRDRGCKRRGGFAGNRLQGCRGPAPVPVLPSPKLGGSRSEVRRGRSPKPRAGPRPAQTQNSSGSPLRRRRLFLRGPRAPPSRSARRGASGGIADWRICSRASVRSNATRGLKPPKALSRRSRSRSRCDVDNWTLKMGEDF